MRYLSRVLRQQVSVCRDFITYHTYIEPEDQWAVNIAGQFWAFLLRVFILIEM